MPRNASSKKPSVTEQVAKTQREKEQLRRLRASKRKETEERHLRPVAPPSKKAEVAHINENPPPKDGTKARTHKAEP